jgi:predicted nuclease with TOPRIM domain
MKEKLQQRLQSLQSEFEAGQKILAELEAKQDNLRQTLLRISGAIQVLEEVLNEIPKANGGSSGVSDPNSGAGAGAIAPPNSSEPLTL